MVPKGKKGGHLWLDAECLDGAERRSLDDPRDCTIELASGRVSLRYTRIYCIRGCLIGISEQRGGSGPRVA